MGDVEEYVAHGWKLRFEVLEEEDQCEMVVYLEAGDQSLSGRGVSRRGPVEPSMPKVGEKLAAARALHDLANHLAEDAWRLIESSPSRRE
jgi:hypothetical protein